jgi:hypothetical protein
MDPISLHQVVSLAAALQIGGPILAVMLIWWIDRRDITKILKQNQEQITIYREDTKNIQEHADKHFNAVASMYRDNAELVKNYDKVSHDFREVVVANSTISADLKNAIRHNLFCPLVREKTGV